MIQVSAVITTCQRAPELVERAIMSVLAQTYPVKELVVVDDSPAEYRLRGVVAETVGKYADRGVVYVQHPTNMGVSVARNTGASQCSGDFIAFLDDDDEWMPEKTEKQLQRFTDGVALVYCGYRLLYEDTGRVVVKERSYSRGKIFDELILDNFIGSTSFPMIRKSVFDQLGGFDTEMLTSEDHDLWLRIARDHDIDYVDEPLVTYHFHEGEQLTKNHEKRISGLTAMIDKNIGYLKKNKSAMWQRRALLIPHYVAVGRKKEAFALWSRCVKDCPFKFYGNARYLYAILKGND